MRPVLNKSSWDGLLLSLDIPQGLTIERATGIRTDVTPADSRKDFRDRFLLFQSPSQRIAKHKIREDGIFPYLAVIDLSFKYQIRKRVSTPSIERLTNVRYSTFFRLLILGQCLTPPILFVDGSVKEVEDTLSGPPSADIHGKLFYHVHETLRDFLRRISNFRMSFSMWQLETHDFPIYLEPDSFHRIEV